MTNSLAVTIYRTKKRADTYLFLPSDAEFEALPEALLQHFGPGEAFLNIELEHGTHLAQAEASNVLASIADQGFYLQLPPSDTK